MSRVPRHYLGKTLIKQMIIRRYSYKEQLALNSSTARTETITAFVGRTLRGPVNTPVTLHSFAEFQQIFGGLWQPSPLSYAIEHYFEHGGRCAVIVRVVNGGASATIKLPCGLQALTLEALTVGSREFLRASVDYDNLRTQDSDYFNLVVQRVRAHHSEYIEAQETYRRVSVNSTTNRFISTVLAESHLIRVRGEVPSQRPELTPSHKNHYVVGYIDSNTDGDDGAPLTDYDVIGSATEGTGLFALSQLERIDFVYVPPLSRDSDVGASTLLAASHFCRAHHAMLIVDPPARWNSCDAALQGIREFNFRNDQALMFFPRLVGFDRLRGRNDVFANGGAVAGMLSHADETYPLWALTQAEPDLVLRPTLRLQLELKEIERWRLAALGVNALHQSRRSQAVRLVRRTLAGGVSAAADWGYIAAHRFALHVVATLERNTRWVVLATPNRSMWARLLRQITDYFQELVAVGAFPAVQAGQEFFVVCDERLNTIATGAVELAPEIKILVGFAALHAGQYHSFIINHSVAGSHTRAVAVNRYLASSEFDERELPQDLLALR